MKPIKKQFILAGIVALAISAFTVGCTKTAEGGYEVDTNAVQNAKEATTNAAIKTWDATKDAAKATKDVVTNVAGEIKVGVTNAWEKMTSTNQ